MKKQIDTKTLKTVKGGTFFGGGCGPCGGYGGGYGGGHGKGKSGRC